MMSELSEYSQSWEVGMLVDYEDTITMREARRLYFEANGFGPTGGYEDAWVDFKLGPIPMPFPNTKGRIEAVRYHDLHHIVTGYDTNTVGEFEISAWEIAAGCKGYGAAWALNLSGTFAGMLASPRRIFSAFVRGRGDRTTYGESLDSILDLTVAEARRRFTRADVEPRRATAGDVLLFVTSLVAGFVVGTLLLALILPLLPLGLLAHALRRRATLRAST